MNQKKVNKNDNLETIAEQEIPILPSLFNKEYIIKIDSLDKLIIGRLMLFAVSFLWGTSSPALKYIYTIPNAPNISILTFIRALIGSFLLLTFSLNDLKSINKDESENYYLNEKLSFNKNNDKMNIFGQFLNYSPNSLLLCAMEIGLWNFMGDACQSISLTLTSATKVTFLLQSTCIFTPILAYISGDKLSVKEWLVCLSGLIGSIIVTLDGQMALNDLSNTLPSMSSMFGQIIVIFSAFFYSLCVVRISASAKNFKTINLSTAMAFAFAFFSAIWVISDCINMQPSINSLNELWNNFNDITAWSLLFWLAIGPCALSSILQTKGQQVIPSSQSQIFFALTPFWTALFASLTLENEEMGILGWSGGLILILGSFTFLSLLVIIVYRLS